MSTDQEKHYKYVIEKCWNIFINLDNDYQTRLTAFEAMCSTLSRLRKIQEGNKK
jgi:hypothetical protein